MKDILDFFSSLPLQPEQIKFIIIVVALVYLLAQVFKAYTNRQDKKWVEKHMQNSGIKNIEVDGSKILIEKFPPDTKEHND